MFFESLAGKKAGWIKLAADLRLMLILKYLEVVVKKVNYLICKT